MERGTSAVSRWCEGSTFYLPIISAWATGASWYKSSPAILPSPPLASSGLWKITLFRKCQADTSSYLATECLQFCKMVHISIIQLKWMDICSSSYQRAKLWKVSQFFYWLDILGSLLDRNHCHENPESLVVVPVYSDPHLVLVCLVCALQTPTPAWRTDCKQIWELLGKRQRQHLLFSPSLCFYISRQHQSSPPTGAQAWLFQHNMDAWRLVN